MLFTDTHGTIQFVNTAFTALTGYSAEEVVGENPRLLKSGSQDVSVYKDLWDTLLSGKAWRGELINRRKDGMLYHEEMRVAPAFDEYGGILGFVAVKRDVSEIKARELAEASEEKFRQLA
jgi:PAS domain S-box-containing protein